jgi:hypothetical protein
LGSTQIFGWGAHGEVAQRHARPACIKLRGRKQLNFTEFLILSSILTKPFTMQLTTTILSFFAAAASAAPASGSGSACPASTRKFGIMALQSTSPIHFAVGGASQNKMALHLPDNKLDAQCADGKAREDAIFYIKDEELYLYGKGDVVQQFLVDRSGMGKFGFVSSESAVTNKHNQARALCSTSPRVPLPLVADWRLRAGLLTRTVTSTSRAPVSKLALAPTALGTFG